MYSSFEHILPTNKSDRSTRHFSTILINTFWCGFGIFVVLIDANKKLIINCTLGILVVLVESEI